MGTPRPFYMEAPTPQELTGWLVSSSLVVNCIFALWRRKKNAIVNNEKGFIWRMWIYSLCRCLYTNAISPATGLDKIQKRVILSWIKLTQY